ncbi:hypothetical protein ALI144C_44220 [Actinosynnema sp. ALI-1.44]|nr:hypothetical protein ALI144C_44220 [Actinosynnema sp. ALI-1.44]
MQLAVADEPPMSFDIDELVTTAERAVRRRRALVAVGVSTAAVAVVAVTVPVVLGMSGTSEEIPVAAPPPPSASAPSTPPSAPPSSVTKPPLTKQQLTQRGNEMRTYLNTQLPKVAPTAKGVNTLPFGGEAEGAVSDGQAYLDAFVKFKVGTVPTAAAVQVRNDQEHQCDGSCQDLPQPDGSKVVIETTNGPAGNNPAMTIVSAIHIRKDGTLTRVSAYNYDPTSGSAPVYQPDVALTVDQMVRLATDPTLHL